MTETTVPLHLQDKFTPRVAQRRQLVQQPLDPDRISDCKGTEEITTVQRFLAIHTEQQREKRKK